MGNDSPYRAPLPSSAGKTEAEIKGEIGEMKLVHMLQCGLDQRTHSILKDLYLPMNDETTAQIDAVVVSEAGIFVVEMKNYKGWVFGSVGDPCWTQSLVAKGRTSKRFSFQNPIRQNYEHICVLAKCLGIENEYFYSVVVFPDVACLKGEIADAEIRAANGIVDLKTVASHIRDSQHPLIKPSQLPEVISAINEWQATVTQEQRKKHVDNLKRKHAKGKGAETA